MQSFAGCTPNAFKHSQVVEEICLPPMFAIYSDLLVFKLYNLFLVLFCIFFKGLLEE